MLVLKAKMITTNNYFCKEKLFLRDTYVLQLSVNFICYPNYQLKCKEEYITYED